MSNAVIFLKEVHVLAQKLSWINSDAVVDELKELIIKNSSLLNNDEITASFINTLIYCAEKNVTPEDVDNLISSLDNFFVNFLLMQSCHVYFVGKSWDTYRLNVLFLPPNMGKITLFEIDADTDPASIKINPEDDSLIPVVITDHIGFNFIKNNNIKLPEALTTLLLPEKKSTHLDMDVGFIPLLNARYQKLNGEAEVKSVIIGSSYAYQGFPDALLDKAVNLSMFSGDFTWTYSLIKHITDTTSIRNFILCVGLYDAFYELSMGASPMFPVARYFCKSQDIEYNYRNKNEALNQTPVTQHILGPLDLLVQQTYKNHIYPQFSNDEELATLDRLLQDESAVKKSLDFINGRSSRTDFTYSSSEILNRVSELSRNYQRKHSFENNKRVMSSLATLIKEKNATLNIIVMPFTEFYIENYEKNLKDETLAYLKSVTDDNNIFITDLNKLKTFAPEDFYDADHLNFNGAKKVCEMVKALGFDI